MLNQWYLDADCFVASSAPLLVSVSQLNRNLFMWKPWYFIKTLNELNNHNLDRLKIFFNIQLTVSREGLHQHYPFPSHQRRLQRQRNAMQIKYQHNLILQLNSGIMRSQPDRVNLRIGSGRWLEVKLKMHSSVP